MLEVAAAIATGLASTVLIAAGSAGVYTDRASTAPWTRPAHEFVAPFGMFTAAEFALIARRHMHRYGTPPEALATVAATIRNNGHVNPEACYLGRGPFTVQDILDSRMVADPFHLLDCSMTAEGGCALVLARRDIGRGPRRGPRLRARREHRPLRAVVPEPAGVGPRWQPATRPRRRHGRAPGDRDVVRRCAGLGPDDVDVCELYDPFSFEIIRQFEAFGFCAEGEGGDFVTRRQ